MEPVTIKRWLSDQSKSIQNQSIDSADHRVLLAFVIGVTKEWLITHQDDEIPFDQLARLNDGAIKLRKGIPLPYITLKQEFYGLSFSVTPDVLIPRPETEQLVEHGIEWLKDHPQIKKAIDIGTGSGCIAVSLAKHIPDLRVTAVDTSAAAIQVARKNAELHQVSDKISFVESSLAEWLTVRDSYLICANLPYIPSSDLQHLPVAQTEPVSALDGGPDGLDLVKKLLEQLETRLITPYCILLEIEYRQGEKVTKIASESFPDARISLLKDLASLDRIVQISG